MEPSETYLKSVQARREALSKKLQALLPSQEVWKTWEIGCGHGDFLVQYAQTYPERFCLGIDLLTQRLAAATRKAQRMGLQNCFFEKAKAEEVFFCQPSQIFWNEVLVFYPDPWPKRRHHKHRLFQPEFFTLLAEHMVPQGRLYFETDDQAYFTEVVSVVAHHPDWVRTNDAMYTVDTVFSRKMGQKGNSAVFQCRKEKPFSDKSA